MKNRLGILSDGWQETWNIAGTFRDRLDNAAINKVVFKWIYTRFLLRGLDRRRD